MDVQGLESEAQSAIAGASTLDELDDARVRYLGRKSALKQALREVRDPESGRVLNTLREQLERAVAEREAALSGQELERRLAEEQVDVTLPGRAAPRGQLHLVTQVRREVEDVFLGLGYRVVDGREVETTHYNFDALNLPTTHPARSHLQSLFLNDDVVLRTETSPSQIHVMYAAAASAFPHLAQPYTTGAPEVQGLLRLADAGLVVEEVPVNMTASIRLREALLAQVAEGGVRPTYSDILTKVTALALMVGPHVTDLIEAGVVALDAEATVETIADGMTAHPTLSEAIKEAGLVALGRPIHVPAAMLFVPSRGGISHSPDEYTPPEQCELGSRVLTRAVRALVS